MAGSKSGGSNNNKSAAAAVRSDSGDGDEGGESTTASSRAPRFVIRPLSTVGDKGKPSKSVSKDLQRVINFIQDERHLVAHDLYFSCKQRINELRKKIDDAAAARGGKSPKRTKGKKGHKDELDEAEFDQAVELVRKNKDALVTLEKRSVLFRKCKGSMDESEGWTLAQTLFGVTTYYRREGDGSLSIKIEGELKGIPLYEQVAVLREIDLHYLWAPFVTSSLTIANFDKLDTIGWFMLGLPNFGLARDCCFRAVGCDCVEEDQSVLIIGRGIQDRKAGDKVDEDSRFLVEDPELKALDIPDAPTRLGSGRMTMKMFEAKIQILSPDHCRTYILANVDPNLAFIPQSLLEFVMKKLCGFLLNKLQSAAKKITKDPVRNLHAQRMRDESAFYYEWLLPKFQSVSRERGWDMPTIAAFELTEAQQVEADKLVEKRGGKSMHSFSHFDSGLTSSGGKGSTRSEPNYYHSPPLDGEEDDDDDSDISSLSGTSQSIWKNNPISTYLRDVETKTQERKNKAVKDARRKAAARLRPRPLPPDKKERLNELKRYKQRKLQANYSFGSTDGSSFLHTVDEETVATTRTGRSVPYSPISSALKGQGRWPRLLMISSLVMALFVLLHGDRFLPSFEGFGGDMLSGVLRDAVALVYMCLCTAVHFLLCDVELIYAFEAFEMGMKTGEQVKTFYRGQVRLAVAAGSGLLLLLSITKAVLVAWLKVAAIWVGALYIKYIGHYFDSNTAVPDKLKETIAEIGSESETASTITTSMSMVSGAIYSIYSALMSLSYVIFDWQIRFFVRSNFIGRSIEAILTGVYSLLMEILMAINDIIYSLFSSDDLQDNPDYSWRHDAFRTLRGLLSYTAIFLLVTLFFLNCLAKTYRHGEPEQHSHDSASESDSTPVAVPIPSPKSRSVSSPSKEGSTARKRLTLRRKKKEKSDDDSM